MFRFKWSSYRGSRTKAKDLSYLNRKRTFAPGFLYSIGSLFVVGLFTIAPFVLVISSSINSNANLTSDTAPYILSSANFDRLFSDQRFYDALTNTFFYMGITVPASLILALMVAWGVSSLHRKYARGFWQSVFFIPYVTSTVAISISFAYIFDAGHGILNELVKASGAKNVLWLTDPTGESQRWAIAIFGVWRNLAFDVLILSGAMMGVDKQLYKVSEIDGAKPMRQFFSITVPQITPAIFYLLTLSIISSVKVFPLALFGSSAQLMIQGRSETLLILVYYFTQAGLFGNAAACSIMLAVIASGVVLVFRTLPNMIRRAYTIRTRRVSTERYSFWRLFFLKSWHESVFKMNQVYRLGLSA